MDDSRLVDCQSTRRLPRRRSLPGSLLVKLRQVAERLRPGRRSRVAGLVVGGVASEELERDPVAFAEAVAVAVELEGDPPALVVVSA